MGLRSIKCIHNKFYWEPVACHVMVIGDYQIQLVHDIEVFKTNTKNLNN